MTAEEGSIVRDSYVRFFRSDQDDATCLLSIATPGLAAQVAEQRRTFEQAFADKVKRSARMIQVGSDAERAVYPPAVRAAVDRAVAALHRRPASTVATRVPDQLDPTLPLSSSGVGCRYVRTVSTPALLGDIALSAVSYECTGLCGGGVDYVYVRRRGRWRYFAQLYLWNS
jgi:hypothetical protein